MLNELNELQITRLISSELTLIVYGFFMEGLDWRYLSTHDPNLRNEKMNSPENYILNFFVTVVIISGGETL